MAKYLQWCGQKYIGGDNAPIGFGRIGACVYETDPVNGSIYTLRKMTITNDGPIVTRTGWYLYGGDHVGTWCAATILEAVDVANTYILK